MIYRTDGKLVIATPTKTGTFSLEAGFLKDPRFVTVMPRHQHTFPASVPARKVETVLLPIRHPYARLFSGYKWSRKDGCRKWHKARDFLDYCERWAYDFDNAERHDWTRRYVDYHAYYRFELKIKNVVLFKLEEDGIARIHEYCDCPARPRHNNSTDESRWQDHFLKAHYNVIGNRLLADIQLGGFKRNG